MIHEGNMNKINKNLSHTEACLHHNHIHRDNICSTKFYMQQKKGRLAKFVLILQLVSEMEEQQ
jgi:hypothetical protein